ncbi:hypothetical protein GCM10012279_47130 [Micromonospora yangpuensis]|nr:hypothetical protein GCM10012279_47130 [Micromonospora yangpuensis]
MIWLRRRGEPRAPHCSRSSNEPRQRISGPGTRPATTTFSWQSRPQRTILVVAGVHALGSVGAVDYLTRNLPDLYAQVGTHCFSMVVRSEHDGDTVTRSELACPPRIHAQT